jgi:hypothetical protein
MNDTIEKLTSYVLALSEALANDGNANDRPLLTKRLAAAAEMYALLYRSGSVEAIQSLVQQENHGHGWSFIAGPSGEQIASKWLAFSKAAIIEQ